MKTNILDLFNWDFLVCQKRDHLFLLRWLQHQQRCTMFVETSRTARSVNIRIDIDWTVSVNDPVY